MSTVNVTVGQAVALVTPAQRTWGPSRRVSYDWTVDKVTKTRIDITKVIDGVLRVRSIYPFTGLEMKCPRAPAHFISETQYRRPYLVWKPEEIQAMLEEDGLDAKLRQYDAHLRAFSASAEKYTASSKEAVFEALASMEVALRALRAEAETQFLTTKEQS